MIQKGINPIRPRGNKIFSILFAGDFCVRSEKTLDIFEVGAADTVVKDIKPIFDSADIKVLQWEVVCGMEGDPIPKSGPNLHNPLFCMDFAKSLGIDITLLANNHTGDFGPDMAIATRDRLAAAGFKTVGVGRNLADAAEPLYFEQCGIKIALLNFCENEFGSARKNTAGTNPYSFVSIANSIKEARKNADLVFLSMHGGHEQNPLPSPRMTKEFRFYAENGADLVFNCHTHCPEGVEVVGNTPVIYSPGNFFFPKDDLFGGSVEADKVWRTGYLSKFFCDENGVFAYQLIPYRFEYDKIVPLTGCDEDKFFEYLNKISSPIHDADLLEKYFDGWCYARGLNGYFRTIQKGLEPLTGENRNSYLPVRNIFTCESHNNLINNTLRIIEEHREKDAEKAWNEVQNFMTMDF